MIKRVSQEDSVFEKTTSREHSSSDSSGDEADTKKLDSKTKGWKCMVVGNRKISFSTRKTINDLTSLLPHTRKEAKYDGNNRDLKGLLELCDLANCDHCMYFNESRDIVDLYCFSTTGPCVIYEVLSVNHSDSVSFDGNCAKSSRPLLLFSPFFSKTDEGSIQRDILSKVFGAPINHRKVKPFFDRIIYFVKCSDGIMVRVYSISADFSVNEVGPRINLRPKLISRKPFGGDVIWKSQASVMSKKAIMETKKVAFAAKKLSKSNKKILQHQVPKQRTLDVEDQILF